MNPFRARHELRRYVVNPVFLLGAGLAVLASLTAGSTTVTSIDGIAPFTAIPLGGFAMMAAFWQTRSLWPSSPVVDATPVSLPLPRAYCGSVGLRLTTQPQEGGPP